MENPRIMPKTIAGADLLVIYVGGRVCRIDPRSGGILWVAKLPKAMQSSVGTVLVEEQIVYAGAGGRLYALALDDGHLLWENHLKGFGMGMVSMATRWRSSGSDPSQAQQLANQRRAAAAAASS